uniref:EcoEI_R_C domain-containing protein n=1 Tax=Steinernema glaseri TaxID=37863 RepID=A0A1I8ARY3_9BILA
MPGRTTGKSLPFHLLKFILSLQDNLITTLQFFGEPVSQFEGPLAPESFFAKIAQFGRALQQRVPRVA